jgi:hypothetical protein
MAFTPPGRSGLSRPRTRVLMSTREPVSAALPGPRTAVFGC